MSLNILLVRHGRTMGNLEKRYVSRTDESILEEEYLRLGQRNNKEKNSNISEVYVSPLLRCRQTAKVLFPYAKQIVVDDFKECDFGDFEYKNYEELADNPQYQDFIDSYGEVPFPNGESKKDFCNRASNAFFEIINSKINKCEKMAATGTVDGFVKNKSELEKSIDIVCVVHGGTIMAIMDRFSSPHKSYFEWQVKNGEGIYITYTDSDTCVVRGFYP